MNLYQIREDIDSIIEQGYVVDQETGEIQEQGLDEMLVRLQVEEKEKLDNLGCYIKNLRSEASGIKMEEEALKERRQAKERKADHLSRFLQSYLIATGRNKFERNRCVLTLRRNKAVQIEDLAALSAYARKQPEVMRYKDPEPNKTIIGQLLKTGATIPGATLQESQSLTIK